MTKITIQIRTVYGEDKAYPICHHAQAIARIAGTKTLTKCTLREVLGMGVAIAVMDRYGTVSRTFAADGATEIDLPMVA